MIEYCKGFKYAIPTAFYGALVSCRFEEGDILYSDRIAYETTWGEAMKSLKYIIQVTAPMRGSVAGGGEKKREGTKPPDQVFRDNADTEVSFELRDIKAGTKTKHTTTQGQLYAAVREGDLSALDRPFDVPLGLRDATKMLSDLPLGTYGRSRTRLFAFFGLMGTDLLYNKLQALKQAFGKNVEPTVTHVDKVKEFEGKDMNPLLNLYVYDLDMAEDDIDAAVKSVLYKPAKVKKTDREMWRLSAHGELRKA